MPRHARPVVLALALLPAPALAATGGPLATLMLGRYECERPGAPGVEVSRPEPALSFAVTNSSRYLAPDGSAGTYLLTGETVTMTSGALAGTRLVRLRNGFLRRIEPDGAPGELRCVLARRSDTR